MWDEIQQINRVNNFPWICVGDFNDILYPWEKVGKRPADLTRMLSFHAVLNDCALLELESKGCRYTWMNNREGEELVKERLDRVLCSMDWQIMFSGAEVLALPAVGSDHSPLILDTTAHSKRYKKPFSL